MKRLLSLAILFVLAVSILPAQIQTPIVASKTVYPWEDPAKVEFPIQPILDVAPFKFEVATGKLTLGGKEQRYTFDYGVVLSPYDRYGNRMLTLLNPLQLASTATANEMLKFVRSFAPADAGVTTLEDPRIGPYGFSAPERSIVVYGKPFNAGLIAVEVMLWGEDVARIYLSLQFADAKRFRSQ